MVKGFSLRLLCLFSNSFQILYIFFIYSYLYIFFFFFIVLIVDLLIIPLRFFFVFRVFSLWHPGVGRDVRKKPLPYNYFFISLF